MLTRIITFTVKPTRQKRVADILGNAIERHVRSRHGFIRASILASVDGSKVINIAEWEDERSWLAMEEDSLVGSAVSEAFQLAESTSLASYEVIHSIVGSP